ncbi:hypothetical protein AX769_11820 [Frondihabitans sp. PAMC 28766]|uniref:hypothetical protein n=1 Tax=Frondihabitans sp. PAMC 28766 TaxID=1795630 RepID=UPI00078C8F46|nr:hypothetical protein [Frondihabitans sp. PAMC 28766]AMM20703.1 hypothetical protein AX769_11820 [Frondihabitans sp. PAMC 28766]
MILDDVVAAPPALQHALASATVGGELCTWVYLTVQGDRAKSDHWLDDRREKLRSSLWAVGAPEADVLAIDDALARPLDAVGRINVYLLARHGVVVLDEVLPGARHGRERQGTGFVADVVPVLQHLAVTPGRGDVAPRDDRPFAESGVQAAVAALRTGRMSTLVLDPDGFGEQSLSCLAGAPWVALSGTNAEPRDATPVVTAAATASALVRAALQTGVEVAFAPAAALPGGSPVAYLTT